MESVLIQPIDIFDNQNVSESKELCSICLEEINEKNVESIYSLQTCNHKFHCKCILEMFISGYTDTCPLCRTLITYSNISNISYSNFKLNLIFKYSKKPNANKLVVKLVKKYEMLNKKVNEDRKQLSILLKKKNKMISIKDLKRYRLVKHALKFIKPIISFKKINRSIQYVNRIRKHTFIMNTIKKCNNEIKSHINETMLDIENKIKELEKNEDANSIKLERNKIQIRYRRNKSTLLKLKKNILNIPINPIRF